MPRVSSKEQTLRSLFQKSSIADLPTSSVLFADVISCSVNSFLEVSSREYGDVDEKLALHLQVLARPASED